MAVFILETYNLSGTNLGELSFLCPLNSSSIRAGTRCIMRLDELSTSKRLRRRTKLDS